MELPLWSNLWARGRYWRFYLDFGRCLILMLRFRICSNSLGLTTPSPNYRFWTNIYSLPWQAGGPLRSNLYHWCDWILRLLCLQITILHPLVTMTMYQYLQDPTTLNHKIDPHVAIRQFYQSNVPNRLLLFQVKDRRVCKMFFRPRLRLCQDSQKPLCNISKDLHFHIFVLFHHKNHKQ